MSQTPLHPKTLAAPAPVPEPLKDLSHWLAPVGGVWRLDFERWPQAQAQRWRAVLASAGEGLSAHHALLADRPCDALLLQLVEGRLAAAVRWVAVDTAALDHWLGAGEQGFRALVDLGELDGEEAAETQVESISALALDEAASPTVRLLNATLHDALQDGASDLHIECTTRGAVMRFRIDGVLCTVREVEGRALAEQLVSRLKVLAELDIGERRLPQDGRFKLRVLNRLVDFRLSVMPSIHGEDAVVRLLDRSRIQQGHASLTLESLGFGASHCQAVRTLVRQPHGMVLVTGPTGSGKTTTLYAAVGEINQGRDKIITIEDPVEYELPGVVQIPVNEKKGLTFSRGLRSILRHDPDRVMVGEIRDAETAQIAVQAALTGHLVFSTVHANSAFDVIGRFSHMGLDLYNVAAALNAVVAQRLVRMLCPNCAVPVQASSDQLRVLGLAPLEVRMKRAVGCGHCKGTGYRGRKAVAELLHLNDELRDQIVGRASMRQMKATAHALGMVPLRAQVLQAVGQGITSWEELERVTLDELVGP